MTSAPPPPRNRSRERGQVIVIFAGGIVLLLLLMAVVVDVSWYWANTLRVQRAADAAALAGAVYLPGDINTAVVRARAEATKNGYTAGGGVTVTPCSDANAPSGCVGGSGNDRQLNVRVSAPVGTFFMRVIGISAIQATRTSKAEFVLPVPMGSPLSYYGVGCLDTNASGGGEPQCITVANNSNGPSGVPSAPARLGCDSRCPRGDSRCSGAQSP
jgi:hypothetical protein